ncbi:MAG: hypothetical protein P8O99_02055 [Pseudomonadales bacterium]|nr:hypothetical protein [Pseudomonadales bacterium]
MKKIWISLRNYLSAIIASDIQRLKHFSISTVIFFVGYVMVYWCENNMPPSLEQELTTLAFLFISACAFIWAMTMQICYIIAKTLK